MKKRIMIDLETLGTGSSSVILSIGAVEFDYIEGLGAEFYVNVNVDTCLEAGLKIDGDTLMWWMRQDHAARSALGTNEVTLERALRDLTDKFDWDGAEVWCNGLAFDLPILESAYRATKQQVPWEYWNARDYRTLKNEMEYNAFKRLEVAPAVKHNALCDAQAQALTLIAMRSFEASNAVA